MYCCGMYNVATSLCIRMLRGKLQVDLTICFSVAPGTRSSMSKANAGGGSGGLVSMPSDDEADSEGEAELTSGEEAESESD